MKEIWIKVRNENSENYIHAYQTDVTIIGIEDEDFEDLYGMPEEEYKDDIMFDIYFPSVDEDGEFCMKEDDGGCIMCDKYCEDMGRVEFTKRVFDFIYGGMPSRWEVMDIKE